MMIPEKTMEQAIRGAIEERLNKIIAIEIEDALNKAKEKIAKEIPRIACSLYKQFSVEMYHEQIIIKVNLGENKPIL